MIYPVLVLKKLHEQNFPASWLIRLWFVRFVVLILYLWMITG